MKQILVGITVENEDVWDVLAAMWAGLESEGYGPPNVAIADPDVPGSVGVPGTLTLVEDGDEEP